MLTRVVAVLALAIASMALFFALDLWLDDRFVRRFQQQEQMTVRPRAKYRAPGRESRVPRSVYSTGDPYPQGSGSAQWTAPSPQSYSANIKPGQDWMAG